MKLRFDPYLYEEEEKNFMNKQFGHNNVVYYINQAFEDEKVDVLEFLSKPTLILSILEYGPRKWSNSRSTIPDIELGDFFTDIGYSYTEYKELDSFTEFVIAVVLTDRQLEKLLEQLTKSEICNIFKILFNTFTKDIITETLFSEIL